MKKIIKKVFIYLKSIFISFFSFLKPNIPLIISIIMFESLTLVSSMLVGSAFDDSNVNEITERITETAASSDYGYSVNTVNMEIVGNSDYFIYSNNNLQEFQMRNQQFDGDANFVFASYVPNNGKSAFKTILPSTEELDMSVLLFESKYNGTSFYFDLPLIAGAFQRYTEKTRIVITDKFAEKLVEGSSDYSSLINTEVDAKYVATNISSETTYIISAIVGTSTKFGQLLCKIFGDNFLFMPEYNSFQMNGTLYFIGSTDKNENNELTRYVLNNYKRTNGVARDLSFGYNANYKFYEYSKDGELILDKNNTDLNIIIEYYSSITPIIYCIMGVFVFIVSIVLFTKTFIDDKHNNINNSGIKLATLWILSSISLFLVSFIYKNMPMITIIKNVKLTTYSHITSSIIVMVWVVFVFYSSLLILFKKNKD